MNRPQSRRIWIFRAAARLCALLGLAFAVVPRNAGAASVPMLVDFTSALQALSRTFDPRDDQQWDNMSKFLASPDLRWIVEYSFSKERTRGIYCFLYSQCERQGSNAANMLQVVEAGRSVDAGELNVVVTPAVFAELQQTLKTPKNVSVLFRVGKGPRGLCALRFKYLEH